AFALQLRHDFINKAWPIRLPVGECEGHPTGVGSTHLEGAHRLQPERLQALARRALGPPVPAAHDNPAVLEAAYLIARVVRMSERAAVKKAEQCEIYVFVPIFRQWTPVGPAALAADERQCWNGRLAADLLDDVGARPRQRQFGQVAVKHGID